MTKLWRKFWATRSRKSTLLDILAFAGERDSSKLSTEEAENRLMRSANRVIRYAETEEYAAWAREAADEAASCLKKLADPTVGADESQFYRGALSAIRDLMAIETSAHHFREDYARKEKEAASKKIESKIREILEN